MQSEKPPKALAATVRLFTAARRPEGGGHPARHLRDCEERRAGIQS